MKAILEKPIIVDMVQGEIHQAKISRSEPEWSLNLKKALALLFQAKIDSSSWLPSVDNQVNFLHIPSAGVILNINNCKYLHVDFGLFVNSSYVNDLKNHLLQPN